MKKNKKAKTEFSLVLNYPGKKPVTFLFTQEDLETTDMDWLTHEIVDASHEMTEE